MDEEIKNRIKQLKEMYPENIQQIDKIINENERLEKLLEESIKNTEIILKKKGLIEGNCYDYSVNGSDYKYIGKFSQYEIYEHGVIFYFSEKTFSVSSENLPNIVFDVIGCKTKKSWVGSLFNSSRRFTPNSYITVPGDEVDDEQLGGFLYKRKSKKKRKSKRKRTSKFLEIPLLYNKKKTLKR